MALPDGVPNLLNAASWPSQILIQSRAIYDLYLNIFGKKTNKYEIMLDGERYIDAGITSVNVTESAKITNVRLEQGSFSSINKVIEPREVQVQIVKSYKPKGLQIFSEPLQGIQDFFSETNNDPEIETLIKKLQDMRLDFKLYQVKTPDYVYENLNLVDLKRSITVEQNYKMFVGDLTFMEIIDVSEGLIKKEPEGTKTDSGQATVDKGQVQTTPLAPQTDIQVTPI